MSLLALPTKVLTLIIRELDTESVYNLYQTCKYFRDLINTPDVVKRCQFSLNTFATVKSFNLTFFKAISGHLKALNLSSVQDLNKLSLITVLKMLKNLTDLDVTFTAITMPDYHECVKLTPGLKSLAINFTFGENYKINKDLLLDYQQAFAGLKNVHFVGSSSHLVDRKLAVSILQKTDLFNLKLTVCYLRAIKNKNLEFDDCDNEVSLKSLQLQVYFIQEVFDSPLSTPGIFELIDLNKYEIVLIQTCFKTVFATERLQEFIYKHFKVDVDSLNYAQGMVGQVVLLFWDKEQTKFDGEFYSKLLVILQEYLVYKFEFTDHTETPVPEMYKWYHVKQFAPGYAHDSYGEVMAKRARLATKTFSINYDNAFKNKKDSFKLKITFMPISRPLSLHNCGFLSKISHLILNKDCQLSAAFYNNIFTYCVSLVTLEITRERGIVATPLVHLAKSKSLKNILLHVRGTNMAPIYTNLSRCKTLENIKLVNTTLKRLEEVEYLPDPTELFTQCDRLYNICLESFFLEESDNDKQLRDYEAVRSRLGKDWLNIDIIRFADARFGKRYNPYISVFNVYRLQPM